VRDDAKRGLARQLRDQLLGRALGEERVLRVGGSALEREDGEP
jgi:hypothetical protein